MKKHILIVMAALLCTWLFCGCEEKELTGKNEQGSKEQYLIVTPFGGIEEDTAKLISLCLEEKGYASVIEHVDAVPSERDGVIGVIAVGCEARVAEGVPYVRASFDMGEEPKENVIAPCLTSGNVARAALLLLPEASRFFVFSSEPGAADVQAACDVLDASGVDYTVETIGSGTLEEAVRKAEEKGSDALILPSDRLCGGGFEITGDSFPVFAVGEGEPVQGALASFCIDAQRMARDTSDIAVALLEGRETELRAESYYVLCISKCLAEKFTPDIEAVKEDFHVVIVE
ncbi:MAG: hypothetical protein E7647_07695 [Ruminococcaceae bacterium]|nr:hypothetical protein [Oscillospiraceae bacterium]